MGVMGTELQALKAIADRGGTASIHQIAQKIGQGTDYTRIICNGIGRADYIDVGRRGICEITPKGWAELDKRGWQKEEKEKAGAGVATAVQCPHCGEPNKPDRAFCAYCKKYLAAV